MILTTLFPWPFELKRGVFSWGVPRGVWEMGEIKSSFSFWTTISCSRFTFTDFHQRLSENETLNNSLNPEIKHVWIQKTTFHILDFQQNAISAKALNPGWDCCIKSSLSIDPSSGCCVADQGACQGRQCRSSVFGYIPNKKS